MSTRLLFSGVPTAPDVEKLMEKIGVPAVGSVASYEAVCGVIGCTRDSSRFASVVTAWRKRLFDVHNIVLVAVPNVGFEAISNSRRVAVSATRFKHGLRRIRQSATVAARTDAVGLTSDEVRARDHIVGIGAKLQLVAATESRTAHRQFASLKEKTA